MDPTSAPEPALPTPLSPDASAPPTRKNWQLPTGIEDHIESGLVKLTAGVLVGGALGMLLFRSSPGKGWRSASIAAGAGVALGSTYVRFASQAAPVNTPTAAASKRIQTFDTKPVPQVGTVAPPKV